MRTVGCFDEIITADRFFSRKFFISNAGGALQNSGWIRVPVQPVSWPVCVFLICASAGGGEMLFDA